MRFFGVLCQAEQSCSALVVPVIAPWAAEALKRAPLQSLPRAMRRFLAILAPWPQAMADVTETLRAWLPEMLEDNAHRNESLPGLLEVVKAGWQTGVLDRDGLPESCRLMSELCKRKAVWVAGRSWKVVSDDYASNLAGWLATNLTKNAAGVRYLPSKNCMISLEGTSAEIAVCPLGVPMRNSRT